MEFLGPHNWDPETFVIEHVGKAVRLEGDFRDSRQALINDTKWLSWSELIESREAQIATAKKYIEEHPDAWNTRIKFLGVKHLREFKESNIYESEGRLAWMKTMPQTYDAEAPLTAKEKLDVMCVMHRSDLDGKFRIDFIDDAGQFIYFDLHRKPLVHIDGDIIKSATAGMSNKEMYCGCTPFGQINGFDDSGFEVFKYYLARSIKKLILRKVRVKERYGKHKEEWYRCEYCRAVWRLVYPDDSFRGLWSKAKLAPYIDPLAGLM